MKCHTIIAASIAISSFTAAAAANEANHCSTHPIPAKNDQEVRNHDGVYLGYISPNSDGSWFLWLKGKGALNQTAADHQEAVARVCGEQS